MIVVTFTHRDIYFHRDCYGRPWGCYFFGEFEDKWYTTEWKNVCIDRCGVGNTPIDALENLIANIIEDNEDYMKQEVMFLYVGSGIDGDPRHSDQLGRMTYE